ncbi:MAG: hypothetical protein ACOVMP_09355 [Chthoniobacterales bacterium]
MTLIKGLTLLAISLTLTGCVSFGGGVPTGHAQVVIKDRSLAEIQNKAQDVFYRHGFELHGASNTEMNFERKGGVTENLLYGNWDNNTTYTQVKLFITPDAENGYRLRARSEVVRNTFGGDSNAKMFDVQGAKFGSLLKKIQRELQSGS